MKVLEVEIRPVIISDKPFLANIQRSNWPAGTWWGDGYQERLELAFRIEPEGLFLAEVSSIPLGWSWARSIGPDGLLEIGAIILVSVMRSHWGQGIGLILFKEAERYLISRGCAAIEFETDSRRIRALRQFGYELVGWKSETEACFIKRLHSR